jgi:hypothetical protein
MKKNELFKNLNARVSPGEAAWNRMKSRRFDDRTLAGSGTFGGRLRGPLPGGGLLSAGHA